MLYIRRIYFPLHPAPQPFGYGFPTIPDTVLAFQLDPIFLAESLLGIYAPGYTRSFSELNASVSTSDYMGYYTLTTYNVTGCASFCNSASGCEAFNVFVERDPALNPAAACLNPPSTINYKCTLWGTKIDAAVATNQGQYRENFEVVISGSNGFNKN